MVGVDEAVWTLLEGASAEGANDVSCPRLFVAGRLTAFISSINQSEIKCSFLTVDTVAIMLPLVPHTRSINIMHPNSAMRNLLLIWIVAYEGSGSSPGEKQICPSHEIKL